MALFKKKKHEINTDTIPIKNDFLNQLIWLEIPVSKFTQSIKFYKKVFKSEFYFEEINGIDHAFF